MTAEDVDLERTDGVVRPVRARLVRQDEAARNVFPMLDALPPSERTSLPDPGSGPTRAPSPDGYDAPATELYVYRLRRDGQEHVGLVADVLVEAFVDGRVRGHEEVQPDRVDALVELFTSSDERSELVALLHRHGPAVESALTDTVLEEPVLRFVGPDGWEQMVWRVPDAARLGLLEELCSSVHYVADGHHRVAASLRVWELRDRPPEAGVMCVIYPLDGLKLLAFHRRVLGPVDTDELFGLLAENFEVSEVADVEESQGCFAVYVGGRWFDATFTGERLAGAKGLDVAILDEHVLKPLLRPGDPDGRREIASALTPLEDLIKACDEDQGALFALRPPDLDQLTDVADRGETMPPKTTYFDPKPFAGIFLR